VLVIAMLVSMVAIARVADAQLRWASAIAAVAFVVFTAISVAWGGSGAVFGTLALLMILAWVETLAVRLEAGAHI
jgi:hypothetical protein